MTDGVTRQRGPVDGSALTGHLVDRRYLVGPTVARGGMATVYEATDTRLDRVVALKVMHSSLGDDPDFVMRFVREARAAARLSHPNVVAVHDQGQDGELGLVYLVMEYLPGHTLRDVVRREAPLPPARALQMLDPVLSALAAAHRAGIVHRDIKPENVLIADPDAHTATTRTKVADFGLAKAVSAESQHTATGGALIGTVSYLAPELLTEGHADPRADVYAVGVVLHELLTGVKPHRGQTPIQIAWHHVHTDVPLPSQQVPGIPAYVDALVARACVRDPSQRPTDAGVLLHHLRRVAQALADGVTEDPDLLADLRPGPSPAPAGGSAPSELELFGRDDPDGDTWPPHHTPHHTPHQAPVLAEPPVALPRQGSPRRRGPVVVLVLVLLVGLLAGGAYWLGVGRYTAVPGVLGLSEAAAVERIEAAGLDADVGQPQYSESVPQGEVLGTDPAPAEDVLDGGTVAVVVSLGPERYEVPRLRNRTEDDAQDALLELDLEVGPRIERFNGEVDAGLVVRSEPGPGTSLRPGDVVSLVVSLGPRPIELDDLTGQDADEVEQDLEADGLVVDRVEATSDDVGTGEVISQDPGPGDLLPGETVTLTVSTGAETVVIPGGLVGGSVEDATETLEELGLVVVPDEEGSVGLGFVTGVDPGEGEAVESGSEVSITIL